MSMKLKCQVSVGYHFSSSYDAMGGIQRYVERLISSESRCSLKFFNLFDSNWVRWSRLGRAFYLIGVFFGVGIRSSGIDIYWGPAHKLPFYRISNVKYVVTIHDLVWRVCPETMPLRRRLVERIFFPIAVRNADVIIAVSESTASDLRRYFPDFSSKVRVVPLAPGVEALKEWSPRKDSVDYFLFVGTVEPRKNIRRMLAAYASLSRDKRLAHRLIVVGHQGWGGISIGSLISEFDLSDCVEWRRGVSDGELRELYEGAYCLLLPSIYEGFGLPILEAQSFGVPVITSYTSSMPEIVGRGGVLVDPYSESSIAFSLNHLCEDRRFRDALGAEAARNAKRFSWSRTFFLTADIFFSFSK